MAVRIEFNKINKCIRYTHWKTGATKGEVKPSYNICSSCKYPLASCGEYTDCISVDMINLHSKN